MTVYAGVCVRAFVRAYVYARVYACPHAGVSGCWRTVAVPRRECRMERVVTTQVFDIIRSCKKCIL